MAWYRPRLAPVPVSELHSTLRSIASRWPENVTSTLSFKQTIEAIANDRFGPNRSSEPSNAETASGRELAGALDRVLANQYASEVRRGTCSPSTECADQQTVQTDRGNDGSAGIARTLPSSQTDEREAATVCRRARDVEQ
jgi:hypothetical protein